MFLKFKAIADDFFSINTMCESMADVFDFVTVNRKGGEMVL